MKLPTLSYAKTSERCYLLSSSTDSGEVVEIYTAIHLFWRANAFWPFPFAAECYEMIRGRVEAPRDQAPLQGQARSLRLASRRGVLPVMRRLSSPPIRLVRGGRTPRKGAVWGRCRFASGGGPLLPTKPAGRLTLPPVNSIVMQNDSPMHNRSGGRAKWQEQP